jgi:hypothetical protein
MNEYSQPRSGKITVRGNGLGAPSPDQVTQRAREIAMIDERNPDEFTEGDWQQAHRELLGEIPATAPEENERTAEVVEEWNVVASDTGHHAPRAADGEDKNLGEQLVDDGLREATHDQMLEARIEERKEEES